MRLGQIFDSLELARCLGERLVVRREHPSLPLAILNYTERCQYEVGHWNPVTIACRGLIYRTDTEEVIARPFRKFFNYRQQGAASIDLGSPVVVTDKLDGSLGILYRRDIGYAVATRGAFESEQAQHATALWRDRYDHVPVPVGWTMLFEIIYPKNRIVVDYGAEDDLVLLGAVEVATGRSISPTHPLLTSWPGPRADSLQARTLADALALAPRPNAEGMVIHCQRTDERLKVKQEDYIALHRIVTGLNERTVWEHLMAGKALGELLNPLPDEFHRWVREVAADLVAQVEADAAEVERAHSAILATLSPGYTRKDFAAHAVAHPLKWALFNRLNGKSYREGLWKAHYPDGGRSPRQFSEDTA
jgi:RNA ligase